jgi:hypothetical protein
MKEIYSLTNNILSRDFLLNYHSGEEILIGLVCLLIAIRAFRASAFNVSRNNIKSSRIFLVGTSFLIPGCSS